MRRSRMIIKLIHTILTTVIDVGVLLSWAGLQELPTLVKIAFPIALIGITLKIASINWICWRMEDKK